VRSHFSTHLLGYLHYLSRCVTSNMRQHIGFLLILSRRAERQEKHCSLKDCLHEAWILCHAMLYNTMRHSWD
jgi:hypothetical protein